MHDTIPSCFVKRNLFTVIIILYIIKLLLTFYGLHILRGFIILYNKLLSAILITSFNFLIAELKKNFILYKKPLSRVIEQ